MLHVLLKALKRPSVILFLAKERNVIYINLISYHMIPSYHLPSYSGFQAAVDTPEIILLLLLLLLLLLPYGGINSRMTSYLKIFVLIDFHFQDAIFPFNRAAPYGMTSAVPREQGRTSARSAERPLALDPRPHSSAAARASLRFLVRSATERRTSRGEISFQLPFKRYPIKNFGEQPGGQI